MKKSMSEGVLETISIFKVRNIGYFQWYFVINYASIKNKIELE